MTAAAAEEAAMEEDPFMVPRRQIARTRVSERVRQRIQVMRLQRRRPTELETSDVSSGVRFGCGRLCWIWFDVDFDDE